MNTVSGTYAFATGYGNIVSSNFAGAIGCGLTANVACTLFVNNLCSTNNIAASAIVALNFASDSAAATGGVPIGGFYHNAGALRIRLT